MFFNKSEIEEILKSRKNINFFDKNGKKIEIGSYVFYSEQDLGSNYADSLGKIEQDSDYGIIMNTMVYNKWGLYEYVDDNNNNDDPPIHCHMLEVKKENGQYNIHVQDIEVLDYDKKLDPLSFIEKTKPLQGE